MIYFTSDLHLFHEKIIQYADRPFINVEQMNTKLINYWNSIVSKQDSVYIIGDFLLGEKAERYPIISSQLNGYKYMILGNHDIRNRVKQHTIIPGILNLGNYHIMTIGNQSVLLIHNVEDIEKYLKKDVVATMNLIVCGHVHNAWSTKIYELDNVKIPVVNVSVEVCNYRPISTTELLKRGNNERNRV